jgi:hypothetical protein
MDDDWTENKASHGVGERREGIASFIGDEMRA